MTLSQLINKLENIDGLVENCVVAIEVIEDNRIINYSDISEILLNFDSKQVTLRVVS